MWLFRAANWSMMPTENLYRVLVRHGITHDTSVFKGGVQGGNVCYDYREAHDNLFAYPASVRNINEYDAEGQLVICGDIHGEFVPLVYEMCVRYGMRDTLVIVAGDCGFGFEKLGAYDQVFRRIEKRLAQNNCWIAMVRGNHDDPAYFATDAAGHTAIEHMRWRTVPDYAVIEACGRTVLCVGGAVSVDRQICLQEMSRHPGKVYYWQDEAVKYDASALEAIRNAGYYGVAGGAENYTRWGVKWWDWCDIIPEGVQFEEAMCKKCTLLFCAVFYVKNRTTGELFEIFEWFDEQQR